MNGGHDHATGPAQHYRHAAPPRHWSTLCEALRVVRYHLTRTLLTALAVGTILFLINHLNTVLIGAATTGTWIKTGVTYLVPFAVANTGLLIGSRRAHASEPDPPRRASR